MLTRPSETGAPRPGLILLNGGIIHRVGPNRLYVELARHVADGPGHAVLRFDLAGIGDSDAPRSTDLRASVAADIRDAIDHVSTTLAHPRVVVGGLCSGADNAFATALSDPRVVGVILLDPTTFKTWGFHLRALLARARDPVSWRRLVSRDSVLLAPARGAARRLGIVAPAPAKPPPPSFYGMSSLTREETRRGLEALVARRVRLLYVFTGGLRRRYNYEAQFRDAFRSVDFDGLLHVAYLPAADHTFSAGADRKRLLEIVAAWMELGEWSEAHA